MISLQDERFWSTLMNYMAGKYGRNANVIANSSCVCLAHACASHTGSTCLKFPAHKSGTKTWVRAFAARKVPHRTHRIQLLYGCCATVVRGLTEDTPPLPRSLSLCPTTRTGPASNLAGKLHVKSSTHMCQQVPALCVAHKVFPPANRQSGELSVCYAVVATEENDKMRDRLGSEVSDGNTCRDASGRLTCGNEWSDMRK